MTAEWDAALYGERNLVDVHQVLFGDPAQRANGVEPLFPADTAQPLLNLPIPINEKWNLTGGPHPAWGRVGPRAALDFAPPLDRPGCGNSARRQPRQPGVWCAPATAWWWHRHGWL